MVCTTFYCPKIRYKISPDSKGGETETVSGWEELQNNIAKGKNGSHYNNLIVNGLPPIYKQIEMQKYTNTPLFDSWDTYS